MFSRFHSISAAAATMILAAAVTAPYGPSRATATPPPSAPTTSTLLAVEDFAVFPWDQLGDNPASYAEARDCGFNMAGFARTQNLDTVHAAGMKCLVSDPLISIRTQMNLDAEQVAKNVGKVVSLASRHPAVLGYHLMDEPSGNQLTTVSIWVRAVREAAPKAMVHINLLPHFPAGVPHHLNASYDDYITTYAKMNPGVFCYDQYVLFDDGSMRPEFYPTLEKWRELSLKFGVPFWFVGLANAHFNYAEPTCATFRFQVFSAMAYGVRGIGWFTYRSRDRGNYRLSAIDFDGRRTPTWDMLRAANMQIHRLGPVYCGLKSVNVFHHPDVPKGCRGIESSRHLKELTGRGPFVVGEFESPDRTPYFLVVNKSLVKSTRYSVRTKAAGPLKKVSSFTGAAGPWSAENDWLAPGQGMLLFVATQAQNS